MSLEELSRYLDEHDTVDSNKAILDSLKCKPFYCQWPTSEEEANAKPLRPVIGLYNCCFNHAIGLPTKHLAGSLNKDVPFPLFDYENMLYSRLQQYKHIWVKKATGLGVTILLLRYMAWLAVSGNISGQMCIVTGPRIELAITLIDRMKGLFHELGATFDSKETVIELNGVHVEAYPSHHLDSMRGLTDVSFIYLDEADFFPPGQQADARDVSERYIAKSNPWIVMVSTPNAMEGLFERIEKEPESTCLYKRILLDYTYGLGKIYTQDEIVAAKRSPSFEREYNLKYLGKVGNVFHALDIVAAICTQQEGQEMMNWSTSMMIGRSMGIDVAWGGTSKFAIVITQFRNRKVEVFYAETYEKPQMNVIINHTMQLKQRHHMKVHNIISDEEYNRRTLEGDQSIYLPQPNNKFEPT